MRTQTPAALSSLPFPDLDKLLAVARDEDARMTAVERSWCTTEPEIHTRAPEPVDVDDTAELSPYAPGYPRSAAERRTLDLLNTARQAGHDAGHRQGYATGWAWGFLVGFALGAGLSLVSWARALPAVGL